MSQLIECRLFDEQTKYRCYSMIFEQTMSLAVSAKGKDFPDIDIYLFYVCGINTIKYSRTIRIKIRCYFVYV